MHRKKTFLQTNRSPFARIALALPLVLVSVAVLLLATQRIASTRGATSLPAQAHHTLAWINISPKGVSTDFNSPQGNYGFQDIVVDPKHPKTVYVGTCYHGLWKSTNEGKTWSMVNIGVNGTKLNSGRLWAIAIDPVNPRILYTTAGYGAGGIWKSTDGGRNWTDVLAHPGLLKRLQSEDIYSIAIDSTDHNHILATFHSIFSGPYAQNAPVIESDNGGRSWKIHPLPHLSVGHYVFFMGNSRTWLVGTQGNGFWRTTDSGRSWTQVSTIDLSHGGGSLYRARNGVWYTAAWGQVLRSVDDGRSWSLAVQLGDYLYAVIGDGTYLWTQSANTGGNTTGPVPYYISPETDGTHWEPYSTQSTCDHPGRCDGPMSMAYDRVHHILYSSNWDAGVWRLRLTSERKR